MGRAKGNWYERKEIEKVTLDWVKTNCKLTEREKELLKIIYDRKLVRRDHLEIISQPYRESGQHRTRILNRTIKKLYQNTILDKIHEAQEIGKGNKPCIVALDRGGSLLLNVPHKRRIAQYKTIGEERTYVSRSLPSNFRHINGVNQLEVETILFCINTGNILINWMHEVPHEFYYNREKNILITDVCIELKIKNKSFYAYLEYDTGSESKREKEPPTIRDKVIKYKKLKQSKLWQDSYPTFPTILLVTEDDKRIEFFNRICEDNGLIGIGIYSKNYTKFITHLGNVF